MCGFVAIHQWNYPLDREKLSQMTEIIKHRGPDENGYIIKERTGFGFRRLTIVDEHGGRQPMQNPSGDVWIVFNGEIYNHDELRYFLNIRGYVCQTKSDTEVILGLYELVGYETPKYLRGMFSFVIWDSKKKLMFGARDPFGIKPLSYTQNEHGIVFSSETKSLLMYKGVSRSLNINAIYHYFTFQYVPEPLTMFENIYKLPAGSYFIMDAQNNEKNLIIKKYHDLIFKPDKNITLDQHISDIEKGIDDSIAIHRSKDLPYGTLLSGGIDSASVAAILRKHGELSTFSVGFPFEESNELPKAKIIAKYLETKHYELIVTADDFQNNLFKIIWHMDEPVADPAAIPLYFITQLARRHVKVVLSGEGADELFGGYRIYKEPQALRMFKFIPNNIKNLLKKSTGIINDRYGINYLRRGFTPLEQRFIGNANIFSEKLKNRLFSEALLAPTNYSGPQDITSPLYEQNSHLDDVTRMQHIDIHTWLKGDILVKVDKMSMANSLEARTPFLDKKVFEAAHKIPTRYRINEDTTKWILRKSLNKYLPKEVINRPKLGFPVPLNFWFKNDLYKWAKEIIINSDDNPIINIDYALLLLDNHFNGKENNERKLWAIIIFLIWYEIYMNRFHSISIQPDFKSNIMSL